MIRASRLTKTYSRGGETLRVLDNLDIDMDEGCFYALMGPSGSGKTTLLNLVGGLDQADSGDIIVAGENLAQLDNDDLAHWRSSNVGFVFQGFNLIPVLTAQENVELPLLLAPLSAKERREHAKYALDLVGMGDRAKHREILRRAHLAILPSISVMYGIAPIESASFGRPSIVSAVGGLTTVVEDGVSGRCLPVDTPVSGWADAIESMVGPPDRYRSYSAAALRRYQDELNWGAWGRRVKQLIGETIGR